MVVSAMSSTAQGILCSAKKRSMKDGSYSFTYITKSLVSQVLYDPDIVPN